MESTSNSTLDWVHDDRQLHEQTLVHDPSIFGFSDATAVATSVASDGNQSASPNPSPDSAATASDHHHHHLSGPKKAPRRRSRVSKKTPTTLLNASTSNFRALVQQYTGCPATSFSVLANRKGPINLNFALGLGQNHNPNVLPSSANVTASPLGNDFNYYQQAHHLHLHHHYHHQQQLQERQQATDHLQQDYRQSTYEEQQRAAPAAASFDNYVSNDVIPSTSGSVNPKSNTEILDGFNMDDDISLNELKANWNGDGRFFRDHVNY